MSSTASIHSLAAPLIETPPPPSGTLPTLDLSAIPSTTGLHHVGEKGSAPQKQPPPPVQQVDDPVEEQEEEPEVAQEESDSSPEQSRPTSPSGLIDLSEPPDPVEDEEEEEEEDAEEEEAAGEGTGSDAESGSSDDEGDEDEEEEEEPTLKYSRLGGGTTEILIKDSASALAVSTQYIVSPRLFRTARAPRFPAHVALLVSQAMGTHNGAIFILDFQGNVIKRFRPHAAMVNDLSIDSASEFVASASMDGERCAAHARLADNQR